MLLLLKTCTSGSWWQHSVRGGRSALQLATSLSRGWGSISPEHTKGETIILHNSLETTGKLQPPAPSPCSRRGNLHYTKTHKTSQVLLVYSVGYLCYSAQESRQKQSGITLGLFTHRNTFQHPLPRCINSFWPGIPWLQLHYHHSIHQQAAWISFGSARCPWACFFKQITFTGHFGHCIYSSSPN